MRTIAKFIGKIFLQGTLVFVPVAGTIAVLTFAFVKLDDLTRLRGIPGAGLGVLLLAIFVLGLLTNNVVGRRAFGWLERGMKSVPLANILYTSLKDLLGAFVGDKRSFDKPVMVSVMPEQGVRVFGFVTCDRFDDVRLRGHVAVYLPQAYNFAGNLIIVREDAVEPVDADSAQFMTFIVSGGVAKMSAARTMLDTDDGARLLTRRKKR